MKPQDNTGTSKFISRILRHHPESIGIQLDEHGWARVDELIAGIAKTRKFDMEILEEIVRTDSKQRYSFNENKTLIRQTRGTPFLSMWNWNKKSRRTSCGTAPEKNMWNPLTKSG